MSKEQDKIEVEEEMIAASDHPATSQELGRRLVWVNRLGLRKEYELPSSLELARALKRGIDSAIEGSKR